MSEPLTVSLLFQINQSIRLDLGRSQGAAKPVDTEALCIIDAPIKDRASGVDELQTEGI